LHRCLGETPAGTEERLSTAQRFSAEKTNGYLHEFDRSHVQVVLLRPGTIRTGTAHPAKGRFDVAWLQIFEAVELSVVDPATSARCIGNTEKAVTVSKAFTFSALIGAIVCAVLFGRSLLTDHLFADLEMFLWPASILLMAANDWSIGSMILLAITVAANAVLYGLVGAVIFSLLKRIR
jgi:hypothetical protein